MNMKTIPRAVVDDTILNFAENLLTNRYFRFLMYVTMLFLIVCLFIKVYYIVALIDILNSDTKDYLINASVDKFIRELDIAGLLGGILGIFISFYITVLIARDNNTKQIEVDALNKTISQNIQSLWQREKNFNPTEDVEKIILIIKKIIKEAIDLKQNIYIMSHSQVVPKMLEYRAHTILDFNNIDIKDLKSMTYLKYHELYRRYKIAVGGIQSDINNAISALEEFEPKRTLTYVTLDPDTSLESSYIDPVLTNAKPIYYDRSSSKTIAEFQTIQDIRDLDGLYLIPNTKGCKNDTDCLIELKKEVKEKQLETIRMLEGLGASVRLVSQVNHDVYLTEITDGGSREGSCLFSLTNKHVISNTARKLLSFEIKNEKYVTDSFIKIMNMTK